MSRSRSLQAAAVVPPVLPHVPEEPTDRMSIEELSRRTGVTVRNLRELQTRGLFEPPELEGRKGRYTKRHLARVTLVRNLQERGYSIAAIADILAKWKGALGPLGIMNVEDGVAAPGVADDERHLDHDAVLALVPELRSDAKLLRQALSVELVCRDAEGSLYAPNAELLETARALADLGLPLRIQLDDFRILRREVDVMTRRFRSRFQDHVMVQLERQGMPAGAVEELSEQLALLRPAVVRGVAVVLSSALLRGGPLGPRAAASPSRASRARTAKTKKRPRSQGRSPIG